MALLVIIFGSFPREAANHPPTLAGWVLWSRAFGHARMAGLPTELSAAHCVPFPPHSPQTTRQDRSSGLRLAHVPAEGILLCLLSHHSWEGEEWETFHRRMDVRNRKEESPCTLRTVLLHDASFQITGALSIGEVKLVNLCCFKQIN